VGHSSHWRPAFHNGDFRIFAPSTSLFKARVGGILRKLSVDELPNLVGIDGSMRLVGPRPRLRKLQYYTPKEMYNFVCKPGITGVAQSDGRGLLN
jgi:lipopolysaccharide/colanic/teichoic acid biosynthesis glycosyltransferase